MGDGELGPIPNPQSPIPNPQSPIPKILEILLKYIFIKDIIYQFKLKICASIYIK